MNKVAVFGNAEAGKSTLSKRLSEMTGLPMIALDLLRYEPGGAEVPYEIYKAAQVLNLKISAFVAKSCVSSNDTKCASLLKLFSTNRV
jgi:adenylate kinase family enzyme